MSSQQSDSVTPVDLTTDTAGEPMPVGHQPWGLAVTPDGRTLYVATNGDNTVTPVDTATDTPGDPILVGGEPIGVAVSSALGASPSLPMGSAST